MRRVALTGGSGQLGSALRARTLPDNITFDAPSRERLDLRDDRSIKAFFEQENSAAIVNCAAYTAVDKAESETDLATRINAEAPGLIANHAARLGIPLIHISTDHVFTGDQDIPWREDAPVAPFNHYGASKAEGEARIRMIGARHVILRSSWVMSPYGHNFAKTMLNLAKTNEEIGVVGDQYGRPTSAIDLADAILLILSQHLDDPRAPSGTFHFANNGITTWDEVAREIFRISRSVGGPSAQVRTITTADYPAAAKRPAFAALDTSLTEKTFSIAPRHWREALFEIVTALVRETTP